MISKEQKREYDKKRYLNNRVNKPRITVAKEEAIPEEDLKTKIKYAIQKKGSKSLIELADHFNLGPSRIKTAIDELIKEGHTITLNNDRVLFSTTIPKKEPQIIDIKKMSTGFYRVGAIADNHYGSRYERQDVANALYDHFEREGIEVVFNGGNWIDGEARFNTHDLLDECVGMDHQLNYFIKNYPKRKGITTKLITGDDHEGWYSQKFGVDVGEIMQAKAIKAGRLDLQYIGHMEADIIFKAPKGQTVLRVLHPGGGSSYATSYTAQKIVESYTGGEKPDILFIGHYHKAEYSYVRGVHTVQLGCTMDQSPFMRKKRLAAHLGGWIIEFAVDDNGAITRFKQEFFPFYDRKYYTNKKWSYKW